MKKNTHPYTSIIICKNCANQFTGNFCNNCGQKSTVKRIDQSYFFKDLIKLFIHFDKGFFYTVKQMFTRPGNSIKDYLDGKRIQFLNPLTTLVLLCGIITFLHHFFSLDIIRTTAIDATTNVTRIAKFKNLITEYYVYAVLLTIPLFTIGTFIAFYKQQYNIYEYLMLNIFKAIQRFSIYIVSFPIVYFVANKPYASTTSVGLYVIELIINFWTNIQFFSTLSTLKVIALSIVSQLIMLALLLGIVFLLIEL